LLASGKTTSPYCRAVRQSKNLSVLFITMWLVIPGKTVVFVS
jgi:hypothetical protein